MCLSGISTEEKDIEKKEGIYYKIFLPIGSRLVFPYRNYLPYIEKGVWIKRRGNKQITIPPPLTNTNPTSHYEEGFHGFPSLEDARIFLDNFLKGSGSIYQCSYRGLRTIGWQEVYLPTTQEYRKLRVLVADKIKVTNQVA